MIKTKILTIVLGLTFFSWGASGFAKDYEWKYWHKINGLYRLDSGDQIRLIIIEVSGPYSLDNTRRAFLDAARLYEQKNITYANTGDFSYSNITSTRKLVAGWYDYKRKVHGYRIIQSIGDVNGSGFRYTTNQGKTYAVQSDNWKTDWWRLSPWELDWVGGYYRVGLQMGHHRGNTGIMKIGFHIEKVQTSNRP